MILSCQSFVNAYFSVPTFIDRQSVLESVQWNQDQAVDALLGMSDPEYKPVAAPVRVW